MLNHEYIGKTETIKTQQGVLTAELLKIPSGNLTIKKFRLQYDGPANKFGESVNASFVIDLVKEESTQIATGLVELLDFLSNQSPIIRYQKSSHSFNWDNRVKAGVIQCRGAQGNENYLILRKGDLETKCILSEKTALNDLRTLLLESTV